MIMDDDSACVVQAFYQGFITNNEIVFEPAEDEYGIKSKCLIDRKCWVLLLSKSRLQFLFE